MHDFLFYSSPIILCMSHYLEEGWSPPPLLLHMLSESGSFPQMKREDKPSREKKNRERERGTDETIIWAVLPLFTPVVSPTLHISGTSPARAAWLQVHRGRVLRQDQRRVSVPAGPVPQVKTAAGLFTYCQQHRLPGKNRKRKQLLLCSIFMMFWMLRIYLFWML